MMDFHHKFRCHFHEKKKTDMLPRFKFAFYCQTSMRSRSSKITGNR